MTRDEARLIAEEFARAMGRAPGSPAPAPAGMTVEEANKYADAMNRIDQLTTAQLETKKNIKEIEQKKLGLQDAIKRGNEDLAKQLENQIIKLEKRNELLKDAEKSSESLADSFASIFSGKAPDLKGALDPKNIKDLATNFSKVGAAKMATKAASKAAVAALYQFTKAIVELALELDEAEVGFMRTTGANRDFARSITESYVETRKFGATAKETSATAQDLFLTFTDFTMVTDDARKNLIEAGTALQRMGVSNQDFAKSIQLSTKALGMSTDQAAQNMLNLEKFAENLGVAPQQLAADFANAGDMVAKLGQNGTKAFKDLQVVMKVTGMSMESILSITNKFDTFEGAAEMAGKLNAALGGNFVNAMDLMMATNPAERFEMIRDSIIDSGLAFDDMSYYQKQFYTDSLGLKDVSELALLMSGNIDMMDGAVQQSQQSMVDAAQRARDLQTVQEKLQTAFAQLIPILIPLIDAFSKMASFIADNINIIKPLIGVLIILASVVALVSGVGTAGGIAGLTLGMGMLFGSIETGTEEVSLLGALFEGIIMPFKGLFAIMSLVAGMFSYIFEKISENKPLMEGLIFVFKGLGFVIGTLLLGPIAALAYILFEKPFASSFLDGLVKIGDAFFRMAEGAMSIISPMRAVKEAIAAVGNTLGIGIDSGTYGAAMTSSTAASAKNTAAGLRENSAAVGGKQEITINVMVDRDKLATVVKEINGKFATDAIAGRA